MGVTVNLQMHALMWPRTCLDYETNGVYLGMTDDISLFTIVVTRTSYSNDHQNLYTGHESSQKISFITNIHKSQDNNKEGGNQQEFSKTTALETRVIKVISRPKE